MNVCVIGTGYVGLVAGVCFAKIGHNVTCIDSDTNKIKQLQAGVPTIYEPGLSEMMTEAITAKKLEFTTNLAEGVAVAKVIILALPTPPLEDGSADLSAVLEVAKMLGPILPETYCVVVNKSTVPVGTAEKVRATITKNEGKQFAVASNPEFLREGFALNDFLNPERIVVGTDENKARKLLAELYKPLTTKGHKLYITDTTTAELAKYAANSFLVTKISYMNEIAQISEKVDADIDTLRQILGDDSRIGPKFLYPGIGYGGSCFPKDIRALIQIADENKYDFKILKSAMEVNKQQHSHLVSHVIRELGPSLSNKKIAFWGLAFKPNTDDMREAPALHIIRELAAAGASIQAYDPEATDNAKVRLEDLSNVTYAKDMYAALKDADALFVATEWDEFKQADLKKVASLLKRPLVFDGRNVFSRGDMKNAGIAYYSIGRAPYKP